MLHKLLSAPPRGFRAQVWAYLSVGCAMLGARQGLLTLHQSGQVLCYRLAAGKPVAELELAPLPCDLSPPVPGALQEPQALYLGGNFAGKYDNLPLAAYTGAHQGNYLAIALDTLSALLMYRLDVPEDGKEVHRLSDLDRETMALLAEGVARMVQLHASPERIPRTQQGFAVSGIKTLAEYQQLADIPVLFGIPGRVVEVLQRRVGRAPLTIDAVANELSVSKRTLQRRLQLADINFAMLRDQIRFHHAIGYLVEQNLSIDKISSMLDFSDRTSFTNAFKRWTGLSPSTFRKLFRDYA